MLDQRGMHLCCALLCGALLWLWQVDFVQNPPGPSQRKQRHQALAGPEHEQLHARRQTLPTTHHTHLLLQHGQACCRHD